MASITIIIVFHRPRFIINSNTIDFLMPKPHKTPDCIQTYYETDQMLPHIWKTEIIKKCILVSEIIISELLLRDDFSESLFISKDLKRYPKSQDFLQISGRVVVVVAKSKGMQIRRHIN